MEIHLRVSSDEPIAIATALNIIQFTVNSMASGDYLFAFECVCIFSPFAYVFHCFRSYYTVYSLLCKHNSFDILLWIGESGVCLNDF